LLVCLQPQKAALVTDYLLEQYVIIIAKGTAGVTSCFAMRKQRTR